LVCGPHGPKFADLVGQGKSICLGPLRQSSISLFDFLEFKVNFIPFGPLFAPKITELGSFLIGFEFEPFEPEFDNNLNHNIAGTNLETNSIILAHNLLPWAQQTCNLELELKLCATTPTSIT